jgi:DNA polymerase-1
LFLVDGYALIYRAFFAMIARPLRTGRGENTSAAWGVTNFLLRLRERHHPEYLGWVHDAGTSFRHEKYPEYKATREKLDQELQEDFDRSLERITQLLRAFRVPLIAVEGYEADDVIGTLAGRAVDKGLSVVIVSGDKDFYQLIGPRVSLLNPGRGGPAGVDEQLVDVTNARERLGVPPERVVDFLALVGDSSDNIPGVKGIGDKTAIQLIEQFGGLDDILAHAGEVKAKRAREALQASVGAAQLSRELVTIRRDVPIALDLDTLRSAEPDVAGLRPLLAELEFHSLVQRFEAPAPVAAAPAHQVVRRAADVTAAVRAARAAPIVGLDTEASQIDPLRADLIGLSLAVPGGGAWYFPLAHRAPVELDARDPANLPPLTDPSMQPLVELLRDPQVPKAGHNIKYDWLVLRRAGVDLAGVAFDSMLASFVLDPGRRSHGLDTVALDYLGVQLISYEDVAGRGRTERPFAEVPVEQAAAYCCQDSMTVLRIRDHVLPQLDALALAPLLADVEMPLVPVLVEMEWRGIAIDRDALGGLAREFGAELADLERAIHKEAGTEFNINSTQQLRHILFEKLQLPVLKKTKTGPSTDADVLEQLGQMGFPVPALLMEYRELAKLKSTYVDVLPLRVNPATGRVHTSFNQAGASTGRLSSSDPNLQNIPVRTARGERIRRCFVAAPGHSLVVADYSQIELRLLAHLSQDPAFIEAFRRGGDVHRETAAIIFEVSTDAVTREMRARAKTINFATIYGQGPFSLSKQLGISQDEAKDFIKRYFDRFAGVRAFLDQTIARARELGFVETIFGRRRYIPELRDSNFNMRAFGERTAMNSPMQGSAADLIKLAMIRLHAALRREQLKTAMLLQVHDELVLEAPDGEVAAASALVRREMEGAAQLTVPLIVDVGVGSNWLDAKA